MIRILALAGSARRKSFNKRLAKLAADRARSEGAEVTFLDLRDHPLPLYDGDFETESGAPPAVETLRNLMKSHHGFILACPEYNSSITPLLKNFIDWVSRPVDGEARLVAFAGKTATLVSAAPGSLGGLRGLVHVRSILGNLGVHVMPHQVAVSKAYAAFADDDTTLIDGRLDEKLTEAIRELILTTRKLHG